MDQAELDQRARDAAAIGVGIDPATIPWSWIVDDRPVPEPTRHSRDAAPLDDAEWAAIFAAGIIPREPAQSSLDNRTLLDAVISVVPLGRAWTELNDNNVSPEAVRKKFARFAKAGVWQRLAGAVDNMGLSSTRKAEFEAIARRASKLTRP